MVNIIAIEREYGSGAAAIAKKLADKLGWTLWDREITSEIARRLHCDVKSVELREERPDPAYYRLVKAFMRGSYEDSLSGGNLELLDAEQLARLFEKVIKELTSKGKCVVVGRGSPYFLRERDDVLRVFMYAGYDEKLRRLNEQGMDTEESEERLERVDRERATFVKRYYGGVWPQRDLYHLMINTEAGDESVIELLLFEMDLIKKRNLVKT